MATQKTTSAKTTTGPINATPCPHCGKPGDYRNIRDTGGILEPGATVSCDQCKRVSKVVAVQQITLVRLRQMAGVRGDGDKGGRAMQNDTGGRVVLRRR